MSASLDSSMRLIDLNDNITATIDNNDDNNINDTSSSFHVNNNNSLSPSSSSSSRLTTLPAASHDSQQNQDERVVLLEQEAYRLRRALENDHKEKLRLERSLKWHTETLGRYFFFLIFLFFSFFFFHSFLTQLFFYFITIESITSQHSILNTKYIQLEKEILDMNGVGTGTSSFSSSSSTINDKWNVEERNRQHRLVRTKC